MLYWETADQDPSLDDAMLEWAAIWKPLPKVVFSTTLSAVQGNARLASGGLAEEIERLRAEPAEGDIAIGGATLAAEAAALGLIDEYRARVYPVLVSGGIPFSAQGGRRLVRRALGRRMATFRTYAEVLRPDHVQVKAYEAGLTCGPPGLILADILQRTGGVYETTLHLDPRMRDDLREVAELTSDEDLRRIADLSEVPVPLGHLRHLDPQTRIVVGARLDYTDQERQWLSRRPDRADTGIATLLGDHVIPGDSGAGPGWHPGSPE